MKNSILIRTAASSLLLLSLSVAHADEWTGNVSGYLGHKSVDDKEWNGLDSQGSIGIIFDFKKQDWPVSIAADLIVSGTEDENGGQRDIGGTLETHLGIRKIFTTKSALFSPYIGGGIALVAATIESKSNNVTVDDDDSAYGYWAGVGTYIEVTPNFNIGVDLRYSKAEVTLFDTDRDTDGLHAGITAGYHW